jgi:ribonuclease HII
MSRWEICIDESGIGSLAGPVSVGAVLWKEGMLDHADDKWASWIRDSKKLSKIRREKIEPPLKEHLNGLWSVVMVGADDVDKSGIHVCKRNLFLISIERLMEKAAQQGIGQDDVERICVDGIDFDAHPTIPHICIPHGDALHKGISAASVLAKTEKDRVMKDLSKQYPGSGWEKNSGYGTKQHRQAIQKLGLSPHHRHTFGICNQYTCLLE